MGTTLDHGIYLPDEGERNCYDGLAGNWVALDNHLGSTNIHVTINDKQAWNGHVADTTIHVTSADKQAWNGHVADTTIHVTSADKQAWNGKQDALSQTQLDAVNSGIDSSKVQQIATNTSDISSLQSGKANDSDVMHKSGNETVGGKKTFTNVLTASRNITNGEMILQNASYDPKTNGQSGVPTKSFSINFVTALSDTFGSVSCYGANNRTLLRFTSCYFVDSQTVTEDSVEYTVYSDETRSFKPRNNNNCLLGESTRKWKEVYATNYYYGANNVEFSTKFVTTDTAQTISGNKTFSSINGVEPSSLGMPDPDPNNSIDISSYITDTSGGINTYTPPANGYITFEVIGNNVQIFSDSGLLYRQSVGTGQTNRGYRPCYKNENLKIYVSASVITVFKFIPCQGNV